MSMARADPLSSASPGHKVREKTALWGVMWNFSPKGQLTEPSKASVGSSPE